jgi:hypothetical protein
MLLLAAAGAVAVPSAAAQSVSRGAWSFVSSPALHPPAVTVTTAQPNATAGDIFVAPIAYGPMVGQWGPLILDGRGNPVWVHPLPHHVLGMDFRPQVYRGAPVLTWWQGGVSGQGIGTGEDVILDSSYRQVARVHAGNGFSADLHDFKITPKGTAYLTAYKPVRWHGGELWDSVVQEVDIRTGRVLFQWDPLRSVNPSESYTTPVSGWIWDAYHVNSVDFDSAGNLLISARNTWTIYDVSRRTGRILWRLGGKRSNFKLEPGVRFAYQHHARSLATNQISLFDNEAVPKVGSQSRALIVRLDVVHRAAHLVRAYLHPGGVLAGSQGDTQVLSSGNVFVGWGQSPYLSEYTSDGRLVYDAQFPSKDESYRSYRAVWTGRPHSRPALVAQAGSGLFASWNGETGIAAWRALAGSSPGSLRPVTTAPSQGFETNISAGGGPYFRVEALDAAGHVLGSSAVVHQ